jgi:hypothetical protein
MTSFVNDEGEYLEYAGPDIDLTKQAMSFFTLRISGDYSQNFTINNNSVNRATLGYYSPMQVDNPAFSKNAFTLLRNGNNVSRGSIIINSVTETKINCFFIGGNSAWFNALSINLKDMEWEDFTILWSTFASTYTVTGGICFPDVDWGYNGSKRGDEISQYIYTQQIAFTGQIQDDPVSDQYPCIFLHSIITLLANTTGIKIAGNLLEDPIYKGMVITPNGPNLLWPSSQTEPVRAFVDRSADVTINDNDTIPFDTIISEGSLSDYDTSTSTYHCRRTGTYKVTLAINFSASDNFQIEFLTNGAVSRTIWSNGLPAASAYFGEAYINLVKGDSVIIRSSSGGTIPGGWDLLGGSSVVWELAKDIYPFRQTQLTAELSHYVSASAIVPGMKGIDLIKFLTTYFNCVSTYDTETASITITKLNSITDVEDWSEYYVSHQSTYNRGIATNNYINVQPTTERDIVRYNEVKDTMYGGGNINTDFSAERDKTLYTSPFGAAYDQRNKTRLGWSKPFIEFFRCVDGDASIAYTTVTSVSGAQFNHVASNENNARRLFRITSANGNYDGYGVLKTITGTTSVFYGIDYINTTTGFLIAQEVERKTSAHRILYVIPSAAAADSGGPVETVMTAMFDKPLYNEAIDSVKVSLSIDNIEGREFNNSISQMYYGKLKKGFNSPLIPAMFILPEAVFKSYNFDKLIRVDAAGLSGNFFVNNIKKYTNAKDEVGVELIFT